MTSKTTRCSEHRAFFDLQMSSGVDEFVEAAYGSTTVSSPHSTLRCPTQLPAPASASGMKTGLSVPYSSIEVGSGRNTGLSVPYSVM